MMAGTKTVNNVTQGQIAVTEGHSCGGERSMVRRFHGQTKVSSGDCLHRASDRNYGLLENSTLYNTGNSSCAQAGVSGRAGRESASTRFSNTMRLLGGLERSAMSARAMRRRACVSSRRDL